MQSVMLDGSPTRQARYMPFDFSCHWSSYPGFAFVLRVHDAYTAVDQVKLPFLNIGAYEKIVDAIFSLRIIAELEPDIPI